MPAIGGTPRLGVPRNSRVNFIRANLVDVWEKFYHVWNPRFFDVSKDTFGASGTFGHVWQRGYVLRTCLVMLTRLEHRCGARIVWETFGHVWDTFGHVWETFGHVWETFGHVWETFGHVWDTFGHVWETFGHVWETFGHVWETFGHVWETFGHVWDTFGHVWETFGHVWDTFGDVWDRLGYVWKWVGEGVLGGGWGLQGRGRGGQETVNTPCTVQAWPSAAKIAVISWLLA